MPFELEVVSSPSWARTQVVVLSGWTRTRVVALLEVKSLPDWRQVGKEKMRASGTRKGVFK